MRRILPVALLALLVSLPAVRASAADDDAASEDAGLAGDDNSSDVKRLLRKEAREIPDTDRRTKMKAVSSASKGFNDVGTPGSQEFQEKKYEEKLQELRKDKEHAGPVAAELMEKVRNKLEVEKQPEKEKYIDQLLRESRGSGSWQDRERGGRSERSIQQRWEQARPWARSYSRRHPHDPRARYYHAMTEYYTNNPREAFESAGPAIRMGKVDPEILVVYGGSAYQLGDYGLATRSGKLALEMDSSHKAAQALYQLAQGKTSAINLPSALSASEALGGLVGPQDGAEPPALGFEGETDLPRVDLGREADLAGEAAARTLEQASAGVRQSAALTKQAAAALAVRDYASAYSIASQAIALNARNAQALNYRAIADNKLALFPQAVADASASLDLAPGNAPALQSRSWAFSKQGLYKEGLADANYTLEKEPGNSFAFQNRAFALAGLGDRDGALESLRRSAELDPRFRPKYEAAVQAPTSADLLLLFNDQPAAKAAPAAEPAPPAAPGRNARFLRLLLLSLSGGLLLAMAVLNVVSATWRDRIQGTIRRVLNRNPGVPEAAAASGADFWTQYELLRTIGTGGMGVVYEARDRALDRRVAVKKMLDAIRSDPGERRRFVTEARTVAALHHPHVVNIYSIVEDDRDVYLVFEYVSGSTLADALKANGPMAFETARKVFKDVCAAVAYAHRQKVIHRDIKPSNVMITEDGAVKVMDFGVARQAKDAVTKMSMTNTVAGTPPYMAPEQEQGTVRRESDVYSLAVCFYEMLCGRLPFTGQGAGMLLNKINGRHTPISKQPTKGVPEGMEEVFAKALDPDPERRYKTPDELLAAVEALSQARQG